MKLRNIIAATLIATSALGAAAQAPWIHVYLNEEKDENGLIGFPSMPVNEIHNLQFTRVGKQYRKMMLEGPRGNFELALSNIKYFEIGPNVPIFRFTTDPVAEEVESKEEYLNGTLTLEGCGLVDDFNGEMLIRGRGNSTWNYNKKAYRIKFPVKTKICGFRKAKNYVLLANFLDPTLMRNQVAFTTAQLVGMPYPNHAMAVDVWFNDLYKGSYMLTEKCGFNNGSVDLPAEVEANSVMFELDTNFDEDFRTVSSYFGLPVNLKDPDAPVDPTEAEAWWQEWMADFGKMEEAVFSGQGIGDQIDYTSLARYLLTFNLCCNQELNHPKSVYLYKTRGGKYQFGPAWDFDWAFGYRPSYCRDKSEPLSAQERRALIDEAVAQAKKQGDQWVFFNFNGVELMWVGGETFYWLDSATGSYMGGWPDTYRNLLPSYENYLLGHGLNNNNANGMGNGGEFFLSIIMNNPEFMAEYKKVWDEFEARLPLFWEAFDAYAESLKPTYENNKVRWGQQSPNPGDAEFSDAEFSREGAVSVLRTWVEKRLQFISDPAQNYGLFDPQTTYQPEGGKRP